MGHTYIVALGNPWSLYPLALVLSVRLYVGLAVNIIISLHQSAWFMF